MTDNLIRYTDIRPFQRKDKIDDRDLLPDFVRHSYEIHEWKHASAVLHEDFPNDWKDICEVLTVFRFKRSWIAVGGGRKSKLARAIDHEFFGRGWVEKGFETKVIVDRGEIDSPTHKVDCFKNRVALEVEWNNKDPFFDRDLNNFRLLFASSSRQRRNQHP